MKQRAPLHLLLCMVLILVLAAALAPWLYWGSKELLHYVDAAQWPWVEVQRADFTRVFNRAVLVAALVVLPLYGKRLGLSRELLPSLRFSGRSLVELSVGAVLAGGLLLALGWGYVEWRIYRMREPAIWGAVAEPITAALGASLVEEFLFRGLILGMMLKALPRGVAVLACTLLFAAVHFLTPPDALILNGDHVQAGTGFWLLGVILRNFSQADFLLMEFCTLAAVGWALAQARLSTGALWLPIGLHAGWVFGLKWFSGLTRSSVALRRGDYFPWVGENLKAGLLSFFVVLLTGWLAAWLFRRRSTAS